MTCCPKAPAASARSAPARTADKERGAPDRVISQRLLLEEGVRSDKRHHPIGSDRGLYQRPQPANLKRGVGIDSVRLNGLTAEQEFSAGVVCNVLPRILAMGLEGASHTFALKETLANAVAFCNRCVDKPQGEREALLVLRVRANDERDVHGLNMKNPGRAGAFTVTLLVSVVAASEYGDQVKQVDEEVKNIQI